MTSNHKIEVENRRADDRIPDGRKGLLLNREMRLATRTADQIRDAFNGRRQAETDAERANAAAESEKSFAEFVQALQNAAQAEAAIEIEDSPAQTNIYNPHAVLNGIELATEEIALNPDIIPISIPEEISNQFADNPEGLMEWLKQRAAETLDIPVEDLDIEETEDVSGAAATTDETPETPPKKRKPLKRFIIKGLITLQTLILLACTVGPIQPSENPPPTPTPTTIPVENEEPTPVGEEPTTEAVTPENAASATELPPVETATSTPPIEQEPTATPTEIPPTPEVVTPNFASALAEARQNPEFAAYGYAFDVLETPPYQFKLLVPNDKGRYDWYSVYADAEISFENRADGFYLLAKVEGVEQPIEVKWFKFNLPGVETQGWWGVTQFKTPLVTMALGSSMDVKGDYTSKRGEYSMPDSAPELFSVMSLHLGPAITDRWLDWDIEFYGNSEESLLEAFKVKESWGVGVDYSNTPPPIIYEGLDDPEINGVKLMEDYMFHTFANGLWHTSYAPNEQRDAVSAFFYNTATEEQKNMIYSAPNYAGETGSNTLRLSYPGGFWDLRKGISAIWQAAPENGEPLSFPIEKVPYGTPTKKYYFVDEGLVLRIFGGEGQAHRLLGRLLVEMGLEPEGNAVEAGITIPVFAYNRQYEHFVRVTSGGKTGLTYLDPYKVIHN